MDAEQWADLLNLREKACLTPSTDYRFELLEMYLSALYTLNIFSQEDKKRFNTEFNELSDQDRQDLCYRVANKTNPNFFHLTYEEMERLQAARKELSFHERARLFSDLILTATGTAWLDLGKVFDAEIEIDDNSSPDRWRRPYAHIFFSNGHRRQVETVDILESVKNNPASIGHPAIAFAIYHWQRVIHARRVIERDDITSRDELWKEFKRELSGEREVEIAERNLAAIGKMLLKGANKRAIPNELAFALRIEELRLRLEDTNTVFHKAWERLDSKFIDPSDEITQALAKIEAELRTFENQPYINSTSSRIPASRVMEFLQDDVEKGGKRFVGNNEEGVSLRPSWKIFRNAFAAWLFDLAQGVVQEYLEKAAKLSVDVEVYQYSYVKPKTTVSRIFHYLLVNQLVMAREPITVSESKIDFQGIEKTIEKINSDTLEEEGN
ncbi:MAG: hypothetical protein WCF57_03845 [Pyrinomonadaceae bacterium]